MKIFSFFLWFITLEGALYLHRERVLFHRAHNVFPPNFHSSSEQTKCYRDGSSFKIAVLFASYDLQAMAVFITKFQTIKLVWNVMDIKMSIYRSSSCISSCDVPGKVIFCFKMQPSVSSQWPKHLDANSRHDGAAEPATVWEDEEVWQEDPDPFLARLSLSEGLGGALLPGGHQPAGVLQRLPHHGRHLRGVSQEMLWVNCLLWIQRSTSVWFNYTFLNLEVLSMIAIDVISLTKQSTGRGEEGLFLMWIV